MYNMIFGESKNANILLGTLNLTKDDFYRYRDCYLESDGAIAVYTRAGGGNRKDGADARERLIEHPNYLDDRDDDFDCTYATFYFSVPNDKKYVLIGVGPEENRDQRWAAFLNAPKGRRLPMKPFSPEELANIRKYPPLNSMESQFMAIIDDLQQQLARAQTEIAKTRLESASLRDTLREVMECVNCGGKGFDYVSDMTGEDVDSEGCVCRDRAYEQLEGKTYASQIDKIVQAAKTYLAMVNNSGKSEETNDAQEALFQVVEDLYEV